MVKVKELAKDGLNYFKFDRINQHYYVDAEDIKSNQFSSDELFILLWDIEEFYTRETVDFVFESLVCIAEDGDNPQELESDIPFYTLKLWSVDNSKWVDDYLAHNSATEDYETLLRKSQWMHKNYVLCRVLKFLKDRR